MLELSNFSNTIETIIKDVYGARSSLAGDEGYDKYLRNAAVYMDYYFKLFSQLIAEDDKEKNILDFGCGPAFSVYTGQLLGLKNIRGLDVNLAEMEIDFIIQKIHSGLEIEEEIDFYKGHGALPYDDNSQGIILSIWSILGDYSLQSGLGSWLSPDMGAEEEERLQNRLLELIRISSSDTKWVISPKKHWDVVANVYNEIKHDKNIKLLVVD